MSRCHPEKKHLEKRLLWLSSEMLFKEKSILSVKNVHREEWRHLKNQGREGRLFPELPVNQKLWEAQRGPQCANISLRKKRRREGGSAGPQNLSLWSRVRRREVWCQEGIPVLGGPPLLGAT